MGVEIFEGVVLAEEAFGEAVIAVLGAPSPANSLFMGVKGRSLASRVSLREVVKKPDSSRGGAEEGSLGEGHAFEGEDLLGVYGLVDGDEVELKAGDGEGRSGEAALDGVLCGGLGGAGPVGGELFG